MLIIKEGSIIEGANYGEWRIKANYREPIWRDRRSFFWIGSTGRGNRGGSDGYQQSVAEVIWRFGRFVGREKGIAVIRCPGFGPGLIFV